MRILVANWSPRKAGGIEAYLDKVLPALAARGHDLAFWYEADEPARLGAIQLPAHAPRWSLQTDPPRASLDQAAAWRPDIVWINWLRDPEHEGRLARLAAFVRFTHAYHGTCVSGTKSVRYPVARPCARRFGAACLWQYYPRRCGGLNPLTAVRLYVEQGRRLALARRAEAVVTLSEHMRREMIRHGLAPDRVHRLPWPPLEDPPADEAGSAGSAHYRPPVASGRDAPAPSRLLFVGRMDRWKGGEVLLEALPHASASLGRPLALTLAGDGPARGQWERQATRIGSRHPALTIRFSGWADTEKRRALFAGHDLLVVPSIWPEPFGLIGLEAAAFGLPAAAFAVGGIPEWLEDGVNGCLAPGHPPTPRGLASAIVRGLETPAAHAALRQGAVRKLGDASLDSHVSALEGVFELAAASRRDSRAF